MNCFIFHDYGRWSDGERYERAFGGPVLLQIKACRRCNKQVSRDVAYLYEIDTLGDEILP